MRRVSSELGGLGAVAQTYTITDLGVPRVTTKAATTTATSVGCSDTKNSEGYPYTPLVAGQHAFYWSQSGGINDLGTLWRFL